MKSVEISLKEISVYVLRRWKPILAFALVLALLLGGYSYLQQKPTISENVETPAAVQKAKLSLSIDLINFQATSADSYHITLATNDILTKLSSRYLIIAQSADLAEVFGDIATPALTEAELRDFVVVESPIVGIIYVTASTPKDIDAKKVSEAFYRYLSAHTASLSRSVQEHELSILASDSALTAVVANSGLVSVSASGTGYVGKAIVGLLIGLVAAVLVAVWIYLVTLPIQIPELFQRKLDIRYLGGVQRKKYLSLGDGLAGSLRMTNEEKAMEIISANLRELVGNSKLILVTGTVSEGLIKSFTDKIVGTFRSEGVVFIHGADINKNADTIAKLADSDAVLLVERLDESRLKQVSDEKERLDMSGKEILGYVLY